MCHSVLSGRETAFTREWGFTGGIPDSPVLVSLALMPGPPIPTKSYIIASPKFPYISGKLKKKSNGHSAGCVLRRNSAKCSSWDQSCGGDFLWGSVIRRGSASHGRRGQWGQAGSHPWPEVRHQAFGCV